MAVMALRRNCNYMQPIFMAGLLALKDVSTDAQEIGVAAVVGPSVEDVFADGAGDDDGDGGFGGGGSGVVHIGGVEAAQSKRALEIVRWSTGDCGCGSATRVV